MYLQKAFADYDAGFITRNDLVAAQDMAAKDSVERMEAAGDLCMTRAARQLDSQGHWAS